MTARTYGTMRPSNTFFLSFLVKFCKSLLLEQNKVGIALLHSVSCFSYNLSYTSGPTVPCIIWDFISLLQADGTDLFEFVCDHDQYPSWNDYLTKMKQDGTWGDDVILRAVANRYGVNIRVISSQSHKHEVFIKPERASVSNKPLVIGHIPEIHYFSLLPKEGKANCMLMLL